MNKKHTTITLGLCILLVSFIFVSAYNVQTSKNIRQPDSFAATTTYIPNPPAWFFNISQTLQDFLQQLYLTVFYFNLPSNMAYLLEGVVTTSPTPSVTNPTTWTTPTKTTTPKPTNTPVMTPVPPTTGGLHMSGTTLMTSANQRFIVKGANLEIYRDSGCASITSGQYAVRTQIAQKMKSLNINAVRLNYSLSWLGQNTTNLNQFLDVMQVLAAQGIYSMPSDHSYTGKSLSGSSASYDLFGKIIAGARSRGIENYVIMNPYNEPYNSSSSWPEWETESKNTITYLRNTAKFKGPIIFDTPSWAAAFDSDLSSYNVVMNFDKGILGASNIVFSNHWYPNIALSNPQNAAAKANQVPLVIGEIGQINPGSSPLTPQYTKDVLANAIAAMPNGHNGVFPWIWNWCDENSMTNGDYLTLNTFGQLIDTYFYKKF